jgi:2-iminobutanoate/2-iminopropanoate deaminase
MRKKEIKTANAPIPGGPYSQGIKKGGFIFISGQVPIEPNTGKMVSGDITLKTEVVFKNIKAILEEEGLSLDDIVSLRIYLKYAEDFPAVNEVCKRLFTPPYPARTTIVAKELPLNADIEIEVIA